MSRMIRRRTIRRKILNYKAEEKKDREGRYM
jgi:hypothetical protein